MKFIKGLSALILSICFTVGLIISLFLFTINGFLTKRNIETMVKGIGVQNMTDIASYLEDSLNDDLELDIEEIINTPELNEVFGRIAGEAVEYIIYKEAVPEISVEDINKIINSDYFNGFSATEKAEVNEYINELIPEVNKSLKAELDEIDVDSYFEDTQVSFKTLVSVQTKLIIIGILVILWVLIGLCRGSWYRSLSWVGVSAIIAGGLSIFASNIMKVEMLKDADASTGIDVALLENLFGKWSSYSYGALFVGVCLVIIYFIFCNRNKIVSNPEANLDQPIMS